MSGSWHARQEWKQHHIASHQKDKSQGVEDPVQGADGDDMASSPMNKKNGAASSTF